ncbi:histidine phosphatase family protein [Cellulomonas timonensis]|uniref:histidine phosphatase family protein n=1 Tax=Cellulomonas timonensis TaxID=1689271 RepID=UPI0009ED3FD0|nr:histidine phosphatase family protein [Cellulomonas timonensis]
MSTTTLLLVRHGESQANLAAAAADAAGAEVIDVPARDPDVLLSDLGVSQAAALGRWLDGLPAAERPQSVWCSPYARAVQTAEIALGAAGLALPIHVDERLRDRELGVLDTLTSHGVEVRMPFEAQRRRWVGKFYYRPPGGESWADVALRMRSLLDDVARVEAGRRVLVVCHDAVVMVTRYVCEQLTEVEVLDANRTAPVRNASVTTLARPATGGAWTLHDFNRADHLQDVGVPATEHSGVVDAVIVIVRASHGVGGVEVAGLGSGRHAPLAVEVPPEGREGAPPWRSPSPPLTRSRQTPPSAS